MSVILFLNENGEQGGNGRPAVSAFSGLTGPNSPDNALIRSDYSDWLIDTDSP